MCGIHGITNFNSTDFSTNKNRVEKMLDQAKHRGPDQNDVIVLPKAVLGMNRLAIVAPDEHSTVQTDNDHSFAVFNGEIVNYVELFSEVENIDKKSDTALILPLWKKYGVDFVKKLAGMFAIAIYDAQQNELHLWRDPLGVKPLYYTVTESGEVIFSSEIKSIYSVMTKKPTVSFTAVDQMLRYRFFPGRETIFPEIKRVFPGEEVIFKDNKIEHRYFWQLKQNALVTKSEATLENFRTLFKQVVKENTRGDVAGGYFVSGGLDSSLVTAMGLENESNYTQPISIRFTPQSVVDEQYGKQLEAYLKTKFEWVEISDEGARKALEEVVTFMDEPLENPIHIGTYFMAKKAHELGIKSVITGDGSDEFFIGYARQACWFLEENPAPAYLDWLKTLSKEEADELYKVEVKNLVKPMLDEAGEQIEPFTNIHQVLHFERRERLSEYHCMRLDRMTMAFGVEAKVPFLDHRVAEFSQQISVEDLFGQQGKEWLQAAAKPWVPKEIIERKKIHFPSLPDQWLSGAGVEWMKKILLATDAEINQWFNVAVIEKYIIEHEGGKKLHGRVLWALVTLELWLKNLKSW